MQIARSGFKFLVISALAVLLGCGENGSEKVPQVEFGANLLKNPSFEEWTDSLPAGWQGRSVSDSNSEKKRANIVQPSSKYKQDGEYSCYFLADDSTDRWVALTQIVPVVPDHDFVISSQVKSLGLRRNTSKGGYSNMYAIFINERGERVEGSEDFADLMTRPVAGNTDWHNQRRKMRVPANARHAEVGIISTMSGSIYFDDLNAYVKANPPWVKKETKYIDFYWLPGKALPDSSIEKELEMIESYAEIFGIDKIEKKIEYFYYNNEEDFKDVNLTESYFQGVNWEQREIHTMKKTEDLAVTHMLLYHLGFPPISLAKGAVFYLRASKYDWDPHMEVKKDLMEYKVPALQKTIGQKVFEKYNPSIIVPAWASFCTYLIEQYGVEEFLEFYEKNNGVQTSEEFISIFEEFYKEEFNKMDQKWRLFVMRYQPDSQGVSTQ